MSEVAPVVEEVYHWDELPATTLTMPALAP